jgi:hypothetical protein
LLLTFLLLLMRLCMLIVRDGYTSVTFITDGDQQLTCGSSKTRREDGNSAGIMSQNGAAPRNLRAGGAPVTVNATAVAEPATWWWFDWGHGDDDDEPERRVFDMPAKPATIAKNNKKNKKQHCRHESTYRLPRHSLSRAFARMVCSPTCRLSLPHYDAPPDNFSTLMLLC